MDDIVDENARVVCFTTDTDDIRECSTGIPKLAEYWGILKSDDFKIYLRGEI